MKKFTLIELLFVIAILTILIGIGSTMAGKAIRKASIQQAKTELKMIEAGIKAYKARWDGLPQSATNSVDFAEYFSDVSPHIEWIDPVTLTPRPRKMYVDLKKSNMNATNIEFYEYTMSKHGSTIPKVSLRDPYDQPYRYKITGEQFEVYSIGLDAVDGTDDDISN